MRLLEQTTPRGTGSYHRFLKVAKRRRERRRAKQDPTCLPAYQRYVGYES